jgi:flagellar biosynthetic protein FlhB
MSSAGDRTEQPTDKRRGEAKKRGQVAKSSDLNTAVGLLGVGLSLSFVAPMMFHRLETVVHDGLVRAGDPQAASSGLGATAMWALQSFALAAAPVVLIASVCGVLANVMQVKLRFTPLALKPSFSKLNPLPGVKRIFGKNGAVEAVKAIAKTGIVGLVAWLALKPKLPELLALTGRPPAEVLATLAALSRDVFLRIAVAYAFIAAADWFWQRRRHEQSLKMTKSEVKQESRQGDVSPEVKRAIKRRQFELARTRMLAEVPTADVVVVNPTHYAVALRYDGSKPAPEVVAKGVDHVAAAIRKAAEEHRVPIVHEPPLARALYAQVEVGQTIPEGLFAAVAEILAFVFRTAGRARAQRLNSSRRRPITRGMARSSQARR